MEQWNFDVNRIKHKEGMKFWIFVIFKLAKHFLNSWCEYANEWVDDLIASQFSMYFVYKIVKILLIFAQKCKSMYLYQNSILHFFRVDIRQVIHSHSWNMGFSSFLWSTYMANCEAMTSSTHSFAYSYWLLKKCFDENYSNKKFHIFLILYMIYITFSLFCSICFTLSLDLT